MRFSFIISHKSALSISLSFFRSFVLSLTVRPSSFQITFKNRMSRDDARGASTSFEINENDDKTLRNQWLKFKTKFLACFWDFEAELADWFGLNTSKFYEELEMKEDLEREEEEEKARKERKDGVEMVKMEMAS